MTKETTNIIRDTIRLLPTTSGVYQFFDSRGAVIYVGKAINLRRRVSSYFTDSHKHSAKVKVMVKHITSLKHIDTNSEHDALLLENSLIKALRPRYNILLKDDKTYPWIVIRNEPFPRVESTRKMIRDGSHYFGPYASVSIQKGMLESIKEIYQLRSCKSNLSSEAIGRGKYRVCLQYHLGNCGGGCESRQSEEEYAKTIEMVKNHLKGDTKSTKHYLELQMHKASQKMNFELAAQYKQRLMLLENYRSKSVIVNDKLNDIDVFSLLIEENEAYCNFVRVSKGSVTASSTVQLSIGAESDPKTILTNAISQISESFEGGLAKEVLVPYLPVEALFEGVKFMVPQRGDKVKLLEFSEKGARLYRLEKLKNLEIKNPEKHKERIMAALQRELHMDKPPRYIECFDNSNLQGTHPVASCVVFRDGRPSRKEYRHFNIKTVEGPDDFASMREIVFRRYSRLVAEGAELPDLIVVDGGKGQLSSAYGVLQELGLADKIAIVGLAKRIEEVFFPNDPEPYYLSRTGEPLKVITHLRDEAHRFGITFHRNKRSASFIVSELVSIKGIGKQSADALLRHFKSVASVKKASLEQLSKIVGSTKAAKVFNYFHK